MSSGVQVLPCLACLLPKWRCVCPYFHDDRGWLSIRYIPGIDHSRPNPFVPSPKKEET